MKNKKPRKHHFLPQFYLNNFEITPRVSKYPQINIYKKDNTVKQYTTSIPDTACIRDYHSIKQEDGSSDTHTLEQALSKTESLQSSLLQKIIQAEIITQKSLPEWAFFINLMRHRVPSMKNKIEADLKSVVTATVKLMERTEQLPEPPPEIKECQEKGSDWFVPVISNSIILEFMYKISTVPEIVAGLAKMNFSLVKAPENSFFITSDAPVSLYFPNYDTKSPYGVGYAHKEIEVTLPISEKYLILAQWEPKKFLIEAKKDLVEEYNRRTIISSESYIYSSNQDAKIRNMVKIFHNLKSRFISQSIDLGDNFFHIGKFVPVTN